MTHHGVHVIQEFAKVCQQFPYRLPSTSVSGLGHLVHPSMKSRMDLKYIKRFEETRLSVLTLTLVEAIRNNGFLAMCAPFDEASVRD